MLSRFLPAILSLFLALGPRCLQALDSPSFFADIFVLRHTPECEETRSLSTFVMDENLLNYPSKLKLNAAILAAATYLRRGRDPKDMIPIYFMEELEPLSELPYNDRRDEIVGLLYLKFYNDLEDESYEDTYYHVLHQVTLAFNKNTMTDVINNGLLPNNALLDFARRLPCVEVDPPDALKDFPSLFVIPNDPYLLRSEIDYMGQWYLSGHGVDMLYYPKGARVLHAWARFRGEKRGIHVAAITPGCAPHPDLQQNYVNRIEYQKSLIPGYDDLFAFGTSPRLTWGTAVAGVIAATTNNKFGGAGICWNCTLTCLKVYREDDTLDRAALLQALEWVQLSDVKVLYLGYTSAEYSLAEAVALENLAKKDVLVVAPAGNNGCNIDGLYPEDVNGCRNSKSEAVSQVYPASYKGSNVLIVGATEIDGLLTTSSNWGKTSVHVMAPGARMMLPTNPAYSPLGYHRYTGTEFSAAVVAGVASLMFSLDPTLTVTQARKILIDTTQFVYGLHEVSLAGGVVDAEAALAALHTNETDYDVPLEWSQPEFAAGETATEFEIEPRKSYVSVAAAGGIFIVALAACISLM